MQIYFSLLVAVVGVLMYALCVNPKLQEIGRISFFAGLLAFLLSSAGPLISLLTPHG
jgi:Na+/phosphate symporter